MVIEVQFREASDLIHELLAAIPSDQQDRFAKRVSKVTAMLYHPPSADSDIRSSLDKIENCA